MANESERSASPEPSEPRPPRRAWRLAGEALWILLAVLLALAADQWRENKANAKLAQKALDGILGEMEHNRGMLEYFLPRHEALQAALPESAEGWKPPSVEDPGERFDPIIFADTAWRTALETQALVHLDYRTVKMLTSVYTFQEAYDELTDDLIRTSFDPDFHDPERLEAQFAMTKYFLYIFVANEKSLLETYDEALTTLRQGPTATEAPEVSAPKEPPG